MFTTKKPYLSFLLDKWCQTVKFCIFEVNQWTVTTKQQSNTENSFGIGFLLDEDEPY